MICPKCGSKTFVKNVREKKDFIWRLRECKKCGYRFETKEIYSDGWNWKRMYENLEGKIEKLLENEKSNRK